MSAPVAKRVEDITLRGPDWEAWIDQDENGQWIGHMRDEFHHFSRPYQQPGTAFAWVEGACLKHPGMDL